MSAVHPLSHHIPTPLTLSLFGCSRVAPRGVDGDIAIFIFRSYNFVQCEPEGNQLHAMDESAPISERLERLLHDLDINNSGVKLLFNLLGFPPRFFAFSSRKSTILDITSNLQHLIDFYKVSKSSFSMGSEVFVVIALLFCLHCIELCTLQKQSILSANQLFQAILTVLFSNTMIYILPIS